MKYKPEHLVKLMLVGEENVGKTSLVNALKALLLKGCYKRKKQPKTISKGFFHHNKNKLDFQVSGDTLSTDGIDMTVESLNFSDLSSIPSKDRKPISFSVWDFGGQEVYHTTHSFFLSERSIFLLVYKINKEDYESKVSYWLNFIKSKAPKSPIIIVATHLDSYLQASNNKKVKLPEITESLSAKFESYRKKFKKLEPIVRPVSTHTLKGMEELIKHIYEVAMNQPFTQKLPPESWFEFNQLLTDKRNDYNAKEKPPLLTWEEYLGYAKAIGIDKTKEDEIESVTEYLHEIGTIFVVIREFADGTIGRDVFLDPYWITKVFRSVLTTTTTHGFLKTGVISLRTVETQLWRQYPKHIHGALLNVLETFEIIFRMPSSDDKDEYNICVPSLLPAQKPEEILTSFPQRDETSSNFKREYIFDFVPAGLFSRYLAKLMSYGKGLYWWRYGVLLKSKDCEAWGLVELKPNLNLISILVRGKEECSNFFSHIVELLDFLLVHWFKLTAKVQYYDALSNSSFTKEYIEEQSMKGNWNLINSNNIKVSMDRVAPDLCLSSLKNMRIESNDDIQIIEVIGEGSFATVYKGILDGEVVAVKKLNMEGDEEEKKKIFVEFRKEVLTMGHANHPNIVNLVGFSLSSPFSMVLEYVPHGSLYDYIRKKELSWPMRLRIAYDIASAMHFLHSNSPPIIHKDLKTPNILVSGESVTDPVVAKVTDFGTSGKLYGNKFKGTKARDREVVNPTWLAPEIVREEPYTAAADVYPYGIILWEILTGQHPYDEYKFEFSVDLEQAIINGKTPTIPDDCPSEYANLILKCWNPNPSERPTFADIVNTYLPLCIEETCPILFQILDAVKVENQILKERRADIMAKRERDRALKDKRFSEKENEMISFHQKLQSFVNDGINTTDYSNEMDKKGLELIKSVESMVNMSGQGERLSFHFAPDDLLALNLNSESNHRFSILEKSLESTVLQVTDIYNRHTEVELVFLCNVRGIPVPQNTPKQKLLEILQKDDAQLCKQRKSLYGFYQISDLLEDEALEGLTNEQIEERKELQQRQDKELLELNRKHQMERADMMYRHEKEKIRRTAEAIQLENKKRKEEYERLDEEFRKSELARETELKKIEREKNALLLALERDQIERERAREKLILPHQTRKIERMPSINPREHNSSIINNNDLISNNNNNDTIINSNDNNTNNNTISQDNSNTQTTPEITRTPPSVPPKIPTVKGTVELLKAQFDGEIRKRNSLNQAPLYSSQPLNPISSTTGPRRGTISNPTSPSYAPNLPRPVPFKRDLSVKIIEKIVEGRWSKEDGTLGGSPNTSTWVNNPQYLLTVNSGGAILTLTLTQEKKDVYPSIAMYILKCHENMRQLDIKEKIHAPDHFINKQSIELKYDMPEGTYTIMCATYETTIENSFTLKVSGENFSLGKVTEWEELEVQGKWTLQNCGGCKNFPTWKKNPHYKFITTEKTRCIWRLSPGRDDVGCGFYIFSQNYQPVSKSSFTYISAVLEMVLPPGEYIIVVATYAQKILCDYKFKSYTNKKVILQELENI